MSHRVDMTGVKYGRLTAIEPAGRNHRGELMWKFKCDCGNDFTTSGHMVRKRNTSSCGCLGIETKKTASLKHGLSNAPIHAVWKAMLQRCYKPNCKSYENYGGRGIMVCDRWHKLENFVADMGTPELGMTIERIDNDGNYEPGNCRWATRAEQNNNTRQNVRIKYGAEEMTASQWAKRAGIKYGTFISRIRKGIPFPFCLLNMNLQKEMYGRFA